MTVRRRLQADLDRYLAREAEGEAPLEPRELELGFGFDGDDDRGEPSELPAFELGGGVKLRGRIDRIDVGEHGEAVVYDYKGGKVPLGASQVDRGTANCRSRCTCARSSSCSACASSAASTSR